jgi:phosphoribosyl-ATP pyrophosphohydrolase
MGLAGRQPMGRCLPFVKDRLILGGGRRAGQNRYLRVEILQPWHAMAEREADMTNFTLRNLEQRVQDRAKASPDVSYTRKLLDRGIAQCSKKLGEEAIETVLAAVHESRERLIAETADLMYHLMVVLQARGVALAEIEAELERRTRQSGLEEKASRKPD